MRQAGPQDHAPLLALLCAHESQSMFPLSNLAGTGLPMRMWVADAAGTIAGMVGVTPQGMVLPQWPQGDWTAMARALSGVAVHGILGPADQVAGVCRVLDPGPARHARDEQGYRLTLADLRVPDCAGFDLQPVGDAVAGVVRAWRAAYEQELFASPPNAAQVKAARDVARWQATGSHRVLLHAGRPVALTGFNAVLPEVVQVGAVYVPPDLRGRGFARRAVGLHLAEARAAGVQRAVLFAASDAAARAYVALGFSEAGRMGLVLLDAPRVVP